MPAKWRQACPEANVSSDDGGRSAGHKSSDEIYKGKKVGGSRCPAHITGTCHTDCTCPSDFLKRLCLSRTSP